MSCWLAKHYLFFCFILLLIYHVLCYHAWDLMWTHPFPWELVMSRSCNWARKWTLVYTWVHFDHSPLLCLLIIPGYAHFSKWCLTERYRAKMYRVIYCLGRTTSLVCYPFCELQGQVIIIVRSWFFDIFPASSWNINTSLARSCQEDVENSRPYLEDDEIWSPLIGHSVCEHPTLYTHVPVRRHWCLGNRCQHVFTHQYVLCET